MDDSSTSIIPRSTKSELSLPQMPWEALHRLGLSIREMPDLDQALREIVIRSRAWTTADYAGIWLLNPTTGDLEPEAVDGLSSTAALMHLRPGEGLPGWVVRTGRPHSPGGKSSPSPRWKIDWSLPVEAAVPLLVRGEVRGVIGVGSNRALPAEVGALLDELAKIAADSIQSAWLFQSAQHKARLFESLVRVGQNINSALHLNEALTVVTQEARALLGAKMCSLMMLDPTGEWLELRAHCGAGPHYLDRPRLGTTDTLLGIVIRRVKPVQEENVQTSGRYQASGMARRENLISLLAVPLVLAGRPLGTLNLYTDHPHTFSDDEVRALTAYAELSALALEKARLYDRTMSVEEQLRQSERLSALGLLAAEIAHEIRNPLTVMKMLHHSLDLHFTSDDPRQTDVRILGEKMDHLNRVVDQVLDFARRTEPRFQEVDLRRLWDDLGLLIRHKLKASDVELVRTFPQRLPMLRADPTQLEQAFLNLTLNAVEAMPHGGKLQLRLRTLPLGASATGKDPTHVMIRLKDQGVGMDESQRQRLFTSLLQTSKSTGTGLGLAIVARVVEQHRGIIRVHSRLGRGTAFSLFLPLRPN